MAIVSVTSYFGLIRANIYLQFLTVFPFIVGIRFDRENSSIAETFVSFSGLAISISATVNEEGKGIL